MTNLQINHKLKNLKIKIFIGLFGYLLIGLFAYFPVHAQTLGLSITPPINEITIIPGKEITQTFTISNDGNDGMASIYMVPFRAQDENGNVKLNEENAVNIDSPYSSWFSIISPVTSFGEKFYLAGGASQTVTIKISPPKDAPEKDYYFTLLYELDNNIPGNMIQIGSANEARIGSNILISISKTENPLRSLEIVEFSAPKLIDSLQPLKFNVRVGNFATYFFKPKGQISIKSTFGKVEILNLAPLNIISDSIRNIPCLKDEDTVSCISSRKVLIGIYKSTLIVAAGENGQNQEKTITTVAFPFSICLALITILITYKIIVHKIKKR